MGLQFYPKVGQIYICEFPREYVLQGEMTKNRPVITLSRKLAGRGGLVGIIPISMTPPQPPCDWHVIVPKSCLPPALWPREGERWAKCDMVHTVSLDRLNKVKGPMAAGKQTWQTGKLDLATLQAVRKAVAGVFGIGSNLFPAQVAAASATLAASVAVATGIVQAIERSADCHVNAVDAKN